MLLFVYGSLKRGEFNHKRMRGTFLREICTKPLYKLVDCGSFPGLKDGNRSIVGELWNVSTDELVFLDWFESEGEAYKRKSVLLADDTTAEAYFILKEDFAEYEGNNWTF